MPHFFASAVLRQATSELLNVWHKIRPLTWALFQKLHALAHFSVIMTEYKPSKHFPVLNVSLYGDKCLLIHGKPRPLQRRLAAITKQEKPFKVGSRRLSLHHPVKQMICIQHGRLRELAI